MTCDKQKGFTLLEVLVALTVLVAGASAIAYCLGMFRQMSAVEFSRSDEAISAVRFVESQISNPPLCGNDGAYAPETHYAFGSVHITGVNETSSLLWLEVRTEHFSFRRLVRCKKDSL